jgi:RNA polymerase primary sigma factor
MAENLGERRPEIPGNLIETINKVVRTSRHMLIELGREPRPEELAEKLAMPLERLNRILEIAKRPISLHSAISGGKPG